jgi:LEA14-like dessication related protein
VQPARPVRTMARVRRLLVPLLLALALPGCAWIRSALAGGLRLPELQFERVRVGGWSPTGVQLDTMWSVDNPNDVRLNVASLDYQLEVEGKRVATGTPPEGIELMPNAKTEIVLPATIHFADVLPAAEAILGKNRLHWKASGTAGVDTPAGRRTVPLSASGDVDVPPPEKLLRGIR